MDYEALLESLCERRIDAVVIGGVAAVLQGVPTTTFDLDLVPSRDERNLSRLHGLLAELEAVDREHLPKRLTPRVEDLASAGHHLLQTKLGPVDVLGTIDGGRGYDQLIGFTRTLDLGEGRAVRVLDLRELVAVKQRLGREKDRAVLPVYLHTLRERDG